MTNNIKDEVLDQSISNDHPLLSKMNEKFSEQLTINELYETWLVGIQNNQIQLTTSFGEFLSNADKVLDERLEEFKELKRKDGRIVNEMLKLAESGDFKPAEGRGERVPIEVIEMNEMLIRRTKEVITKYKMGQIEPDSRH